MTDPNSEGVEPTGEPGPETPTPGSTDPPELVYESNPKHVDPWQTGRKGSICEHEVRPQAQRLLISSELVGAKRYAAFSGKAYCAQEHSPGHWHGYPIGWVEVPPPLVLRWIQERRITRRDRKRHWEGH